MIETLTCRANGLDFTALRIGEGERLALLLHGFPDDPGSFVPVMKGLAEQGFTAVAPYMRGYAPTEAGGDCSIPSLGRDAVTLVEALGHEQALLIGHDWGATAAYAAAALAPRRWTRVVALSVPPVPVFLAGVRRFPRQLKRSWYMALFQGPLATTALRARDFALIDRLWRDWSPGFDPPPGRLAEIKATFRRQGTARQALAYYRGFGPRGMLNPGAYSEAWRLVHEPISTPTWVLAGERDGCIGAEIFTNMQSSFSGPWRLEIVPGAGHFLPLEAPQAVISAATASLADDEA